MSCPETPPAPKEVRLSFLLAALLLCAATLTAADAPDLLAVQVPVDNGWCGTGSPYPGDGSRIVRLRGSGVEVLTAGFVAACDPAPSPDGTLILYAGKRSAEASWQIWRMDSTGGALQQITSGPGDHRSPLWVGSLFHLNDEHPTLRLLYTATDHGWFDPTLAAPATALYSADLDGGRVWRITHNPYSDVEPEVLANGRVVFSSRTGGARPGWNQLAVNIDGTDLMAYSATHASASNKRMSAAGNDGRVYFIAAGSDDPLGAGDLAFVSQRRPHHTETILCPAEGGRYLYPRPLADGGLLASYRKDERDATWVVVRIDPESGDHLATVHGDAAHHVVDAHELTPRPLPQGRSSVVNMDKSSGVFYCLSSHISRHSAIREMAPQRFRRLRVIQGVPARRAGEQVGARILGEVGLEADGSFHVELPAQTPVRFEMVDEEGAVAAGHHSWVWVMPREWRGCIGCHEDPEMAPPNVLAQAVVQPAVPFLQPQPERRPEPLERKAP